MTCPACQAQVNAWLDYRAPYRGYVAIAYTLEKNAEITRREYSSRANERAELIRNQIKGIRETCRNRGHTIA
jgi:hypothetical protein